jgi:creatinine amidohydrolase
MRPYILAETNWSAVKDRKFELAVLPWGATEAHNYHLPYASDIIESDLIAAESARLAWERGAKVIVLPTIPFGVNTGQRDIYLDINMNPGTQLAILNDIVEVLNYQKVFKLLIFNSHGGNDFKPAIRELGVKYPGMFICTSNWYQALKRSDYFENPGDHAEEMETSLMLYLRPDLVLPPDKWGEGREKKNKIKAFSEGWIWAERKWPQVTADTGIGDPRLATREKGERFFKDVTRKIGDVMYEICKADTNNLYE